MDGLERWHRQYPRKLELSLSDIVPSLSDYLAEIESIEVSDALPSVDQPAESSNSAGGVAISGNLSRSQLARLRQTRAKENQVIYTRIILQLKWSISILTAEGLYFQS